MQRPNLTNGECLKLALEHNVSFDDIRGAFPYPPPRVYPHYRTMSCCPFCNSELLQDTLCTRFYDCGTRVNRIGTPSYKKRCG